MRLALERTVARHPALRTVLRRRRDRILVRTLDDRQALLEIHRAGPRGPAAAERVFVDRPFDLGATCRSGRPCCGRRSVTGWSSCSTSTPWTCPACRRSSTT
ncbi:hypothetical protein BM536_008160 [Streptomyces phaeoluteigriseus]|uniref:Condensation domain-containing protein n=1 Tax=Streptomyces phaeoluteigriseus TaxID=114686 RepID=A0A1V6MUW1_9ACTN|nr:hypothetical protein [Streptomyces phaeoluteigriseus]OQD56260.1 hypothetical protein BM536_008160 [Streptomyces phaeoluteigriseus]